MKNYLLFGGKVDQPNEAAKFPWTKEDSWFQIVESETMNVVQNCSIMWCEGKTPLIVWCPTEKPDSKSANKQQLAESKT